MEGDVCKIRKSLKKERRYRGISHGNRVSGLKRFKNIRVAHLVSTFPPYKGGMGNAAAQFASTHSTHHDVTVFTPSYGMVVPNVESSYRIEWLRSPIKYGNAAGLPQLIWRLRRFEVIYLHYPFYGSHLAVLLACILWGRKLVLHYHMDSLSTGFKGCIFEFNRRFVFPLLAKRADMIVSASLDYLSHSQAASYLASNPKKFREIPFWVDSKKFRPRSQTKGGEVIILFVGGLDPAHYFKGLEILLRALKVVEKRTATPYSLRVVGSGDLLTYYQALAAELKISDRVHFLGKIDDAALVRAYEEASFLVLPSINQGEAFGLVLLEAMASGKPVIASNLPGVRSVFTDGKEGLAFRAGDIGDLAEKLLMLVDDEQLRVDMGRRARELILKKYQASTGEKELEAIGHILLTKGELRRANAC